MCYVVASISWIIGEAGSFFQHGARVVNPAPDITRETSCWRYHFIVQLAKNIRIVIVCTK
ncbi:hypothetical protein DDI_0312 [Dickeya dianthicola RNS04.9]|nr:hypothetical protein DDI_0312 [Dickeya dianthicola RNS04.9]